MDESQKDYMKKLALSQICSPREDPKGVKRMLESIFPFVQAVYVTISYDKDKKEIPNKLKKAYRETCKKYGIPLHISYGNFTKVITKQEVARFKKQYKWDPEFRAGDKVFVFCDARNYCLNQIPKQEYPYVIWIDTDDIFQGGEHLKDLVSKMDERGVRAVFFNYLYLNEFDERGHVKAVKIEHLRERVFKHDGNYRWVGPLHETLIQEHGKSPHAEEPQCVVVHQADKEKCLKSVERNVRVLEWCMIRPEYRDDPRYMISLAKCYYDKERDKEAEELFNSYLKKSGWAQERSHAWNYLSSICRRQKKYNKAIKAAVNAQIEDPDNIEAYLSQGLAYLHKGEPKKAKRMLDCSLTIKQGKSTLVSNPKDMKARALEILFQWALSVGDIAEADRATNELATLFPGDKGLLQRIQSVRDLNVTRKVNNAVFDLIKYYEMSGDKHKAKTFAYAIPQVALNNPKVVSWKNKVLPPRKWEKNEIAIFCGPGFEPWSPLSLERGIGGSEEAVIHLSKELTKKGWEVTVYADPDKEAGTYDGVHYKSYFECNWSDEFNVLVLWRNIGILGAKPTARAVYIWLHDVQVDKEYTPERLKLLTKVIPLSKFHRSFIPSVPDGKIMVSANGVDIESITKVLNKGIKRDPHKMIWTSSYDRGLEHLLKMWPQIRKEVPGATLEIMYGWNLFLSFYKNNPERMSWHNRMNKLMRQDGITHHGRVSQERVMDLTAQSAVLASTSHFQEISFITGMKCQILGAIPVTTSTDSAIGETIQYGRKIPGDIWDKDVQSHYLVELVKLLKDEKEQEDIRKPMMRWAKKKFTWERVAGQWSREFKKEVSPDGK